MVWSEISHWQAHINFISTLRTLTHLLALSLNYSRIKPLASPITHLPIIAHVPTSLLDHQSLTGTCSQFVIPSLNFSPKRTCLNCWLRRMFKFPDINGCLTNNGGCDHFCSFRRGEVTCSCSEGFNSWQTRCYGKPDVNGSFAR